VVEGDDGSTLANVTVTLSEPYPGPVRGFWSTADGTARAATDLVSDGGFESPAIGGTWAMVFAGGSVGPWVVDAESVDVVAMWQDAEGNQSLDLSGADAGSVYQDLATVPGETYTLRFALSGNPESRGADPVKRVRVDFGDAAVDTLSFDVTGRGFGEMGWERHAYSLTATSATTRLRFTSLTAGDTGPAIDDVRVTLRGDYEPASGSVDFAPGETIKTVSVPVTGDTDPELDETFFVRVSDATNATIDGGPATVTILDDDGPPAAAPRVTRVFASDPRWPHAVQDRMEADGLGSGAAGFGIPDGDGGAVRLTQLAPLPWSGVAAVSIRFDGDVVVAGEDLTVRGSDGRTYAVAGFAYDAPSRTGTWTLAAPFPDDRIMLNLAAGGEAGAGRGVRAAGRGGAAMDGEWDGAATGPSRRQYPSGDGAAGGDFRFRFNTLAADVNGDARVNALDLADVKRRLNRAAGDGVSPAASGAAYSVFADVTADGVINAADLAAVKQRLNHRLPGEAAAPPPAPPESGVVSAPLLRSPSKDLLRTETMLG
jgi:choice-of-anchor C domain-containing protein